MDLPGYDRVARFGTEAEAEVARGLLAAAGLDARVVGTNPIVHQHLLEGEIALLVPEAEAASAREILSSVREEPRAPAPRPRPFPRPWRAGVIVGLACSGVGAAVLVLPGGSERGQDLAIVGAMVAVVAFAAGQVQRSRSARRDLGSGD